MKKMHEYQKKFLEILQKAPKQFTLITPYSINKHKELLISKMYYNAFSNIIINWYIVYQQLRGP